MGRSELHRSAAGGEWLRAGQDGAGQRANDERHNPGGATACATAGNTSTLYFAELLSTVV